MKLSGYVARVGEGRGEVRTEFWWGNLRGRDLLEDLDLDGRIILKQILNGMGDVEWIELAQDVDNRRAFVRR